MMKKIVLLVVVFVGIFGSCKSSKIDESVTLDGVWQLKYIADAPKPIGEMFATVNPFITFSVSDKRVIGTNGCNRFMGNYTTEVKDKIEFGALAGTKMACDAVSDELFDERLNSVNGYAVTDNGKVLHLKQDDVDLMRFEKK